MSGTGEAAKSSGLLNRISVFRGGVLWFDFSSQLMFETVGLESLSGTFTVHFERQLGG